MELIDREIEAMAAAYSALAAVPPAGQDRAVDWLNARFASEHHAGLKAAQAVARFARKLQKGE